MACILAVWWLASCIRGAGQLAAAQEAFQLSRGLEMGVSILIADCARVLLMTYPVRTTPALRLGTSVPRQKVNLKECTHSTMTKYEPIMTNNVG